MAKDYPQQNNPSSPSNETADPAAALLDLIRRASAQQTRSEPPLQGKALDARNNFGKIADDLAVQEF